jgi:hypothetical protein
MDKEQIKRWAKEAAIPVGITGGNPSVQELEAFANLVAAHERNKLAAWMIQFGFATGHGDTMEELVDELGTEIVDRIDGELEAEREACAQLFPQPHQEYFGRDIQDAIRARSKE